MKTHVSRDAVYYLLTLMGLYTLVCGLHNHRTFQQQEQNAESQSFRKLIVITTKMWLIALGKRVLKLNTV